MRYLDDDGYVSAKELYRSSGYDINSSGSSFKVRPLVSLKSNIQIDKESKDGKTAETAYEIK